MTTFLYELSAENPEIKFSPHCWKAHLALVYKGIEFESIPVSFGQIKEKLSFVDYSLLPVLKGGDVVITDSWNIANYLEETYPDTPSLFSNESSKALAESINGWCDTTAASCIRPLNWMAIYQRISKKDQQYFRESREAKVGMTLEEFTANPERSLVALDEALNRLREILKKSAYIGGNQLSYADLCLMATFMWLDCVRDIQFLEKSDSIYHWYHRMLEKFPVAQQAISNK
jgi:glutathione S-transferase